MGSRFQVAMASSIAVSSKAHRCCSGGGFGCHPPVGGFGGSGGGGSFGGSGGGKWGGFGFVGTGGPGGGGSGGFGSGGGKWAGFNGEGCTPGGGSLDVGGGDTSYGDIWYGHGGGADGGDASAPGGLSTGNNKGLSLSTGANAETFDGGDDSVFQNSEEGRRLTQFIAELSYQVNHNGRRPPSLNPVGVVVAFFNHLADGLEGAMNTVGDAIILDGRIPYIYNWLAYGSENAEWMTRQMQEDVVKKYQEGLKKFWSDFTYGLKTIIGGKAWEALKGDYEKDPSGFVGRLLADGVMFWQTWRQFTKPKKAAPGVEAEKPVAPVTEPQKPVVEPVKGAPVAPEPPPLAGPPKPNRQIPLLTLDGCFPAGTMLQTPLGNQRIETLKAGDTVLTRDENEPEAPWVEGKVVDTVRRTAALWRLVVNGKEILTTSEHPFWVMGKGWVNANEMKTGDRLRALKGTVLVEDSVDANATAEVFNVTIEPSHTYFVGGDDWGFVVWSHNAACPKNNKTNAQLRKVWEETNQKPWPKDPKTGRNQDVSHKKAKADGGENTLENIDPEIHDDHIQRHMDNGDFKRWGARRGKIQ